MSDYMFMLESHLSPGQNRAVAVVDEAARQAQMGVFLTGGAMRDMLGGFPITDLDFAVQGNALALAKQVAKSVPATIVAKDDLRNTAELLFPDGTTAEFGMARRERYAKPGGRPQVEPSPIHDDLLRRDFTINSIALSLHPASRGLLIDPANGLGDLQTRELRANSSYSFYDDPSRLLRLIRLRVRLDFTVNERTLQQFRNAREAQVERLIPPRGLFQELRAIASELNGGDILAALEKEGLSSLFSPTLTGPKLNLPALAKLQKARQLIPFGATLPVDNLGLFLYFITEKMNPKEKAAFAKQLQMKDEEVQAWTRLEARARPAEKKLASAKLHRPSHAFDAMQQIPGEVVLFLYLHSQNRLVHDRIRNYLQKYLPVALEVTDKDVVAAGHDPQSKEFAKAKREMIAARLDGRAKPKKVDEEEPQPA
ncbi:MAG: CCA tRNA nucleotidyltransferase [Bryobacteraceae bacterium]|nr:CCA tRNA nucleotidyltransferase [Bryobacteraceae bacterium]